MFTLGELAELVGGRLKGDADTQVSGFCSLDRPLPGCIAFIERAKEAAKLSGSEVAAMVASEELAHLHPNVIIAVHPKLAFIEIIEKFTEDTRRPQPGGINASASVDASANVDSSVIIEACAVVGAEAVVGPRSSIGAGAYIGPRVSIGSDCAIAPNASVHHGCVLGDRVRVGSGTVIGAPGFGYVPTAEGHRRFPQLGGVIIEDDVEIGANCCVDRAALDDTVIHRGTKLDNLVQVAHGVDIGENTVIAAQTGISGATRIGKWCVIGGQAGFQGYISVGDHSIVAAQSGVFADLPAKSKVSGYPAKPHQQSLKVLALTFKLPEMLEKIRSLEIELELMRGQVQSLRERQRDDGSGAGMPPQGEA